MQHVLDRSLYPISKSVMLPADLLQRPSGHCTEYSTVFTQIQATQCGRGLARVQTGDIVYISNRGHGLQANTHDQEVTDHAL
ncbi:hypothetical protein DL347_26220, partial [Pseudomonas fluorescens]